MPHSDKLKRIDYIFHFSRYLPPRAAADDDCPCPPRLLLARRLNLPILAQPIMTVHLRPLLLMLLAAIFAIQGVTDCAEARGAPGAIQTNEIACHQTNGPATSVDVPEMQNRHSNPATPHDCGQHCHLPIVQTAAANLAAPIIHRALPAMRSRGRLDAAAFPPATPPPRVA